VVTRPSPQTDRVLALINLLASRPGQDFTLAELTRRLGVHKQSCHSMLTALTEAGWLVRHPARKTYRLGPALVGIGRAAAAESPVLEFANSIMHTLADEFDANCLLMQGDLDKVTLIDAATPRGLPLAPLAIGQEFPFQAPFGALFAAWAGEAAFGRWTRSLDHDLDVFHSVLAALRTRGFDVRLMGPADALLVELRDRLASHGADPSLMQQLVARLVGEPQELIEIDPGAVYSVTGIDAPVVARTGITPTYLLTLSYRGATPLRGTDVMRIGARLRSAAADLARALGAVDLPRSS